MSVRYGVGMVVRGDCAVARYGTLWLVMAVALRLTQLSVRSNLSLIAAIARSAPLLLRLLLLALPGAGSDPGGRAGKRKFLYQRKYFMAKKNKIHVKSRPLEQPRGACREARPRCTRARPSADAGIARGAEGRVWLMYMRGAVEGPRRSRRHGSMSAASRPAGHNKFIAKLAIMHKCSLVTSPREVTKIGPSSLEVARAAAQVPPPPPCVV